MFPGQLRQVESRRINTQNATGRTGMIKMQNQTTEINPRKSFRENLEAGVSKEKLMKYYVLTNEGYEKTIKSLEEIKLRRGN